MAGTYDLASVEDSAMPCCRFIEAGDTTVSWADGRLVFYDPRTYHWLVDVQYDWVADSGLSHYTRVVDSVFSAGTYDVSRSTLSFQNSEPSGSFGGSVAADTIKIFRDGHTYRFVREPPPSVDGLWASSVCAQIATGSPSCTTTDSTGATATIMASELEVAYNVPTGEYDWSVKETVPQPNGAVDTTAATFSQGTYSWDGTTLTMVDTTSSRGLRMTGHRLGPLELQVQTQTLRFTFFKVVTPP